MNLMPFVVAILGLALVGCSGSKSAQPVSQETPQIELSDADEFIENMGDEGAETSPEVAESPIVEDNMDEKVPESTPTVDESSMVSNSEQIYRVKKNETLMMIAFKLYGDYGKWKELARHNRDQLKGSTSVVPGMNLKYIAPAEEFVWSPQGLPYLVRTGDTLGTISNTVYHTSKKWKMIWDNNRPLIKDPNKIFAGFTLYYIENGREVAAEM